MARRFVAIGPAESPTNIGRMVDTDEGTFFQYLDTESRDKWLPSSLAASVILAGDDDAGKTITYREAVNLITALGADPEMLMEPVEDDE